MIVSTSISSFFIQKTKRIQKYIQIMPVLGQKSIHICQPQFDKFDKWSQSIFKLLIISMLSQDDPQDPFSYPHQSNMKLLSSKPTQNSIFALERPKITVTFTKGQKESDPDQFCDNKQTFNFNSMFDFNQEHCSRQIEGRYDDSRLDFSCFPTHKLDITQTRNILAAIDLENDGNQESQGEEQSKNIQERSLDSSAFSGLQNMKDISWSKKKEKIDRDQQDDKTEFEKILQENDYDQAEDEVIFELDNPSFIHCQKSMEHKSQELLFNLSELLKEEEDEEQIKIENKKKLQEYLATLEDHPMKTLKFMIKYENCQRASIKAIHSPTSHVNQHMRTRILQEKTYLKINKKKIDLRGTLQQPEPWVVGESKVLIQPAICSLKCKTCGFKQNQVCQHDGMFRILCSNKFCMKQIIFEIVSACLQ